jgi:DNA-binding NtrC family response regulator
LTVGAVQDLDIALRLGGSIEDVEDIQALSSLALTVLNRPKALRPSPEAPLRSDKSGSVLVVDPSAYTRMLLCYFLAGVDMNIEEVDSAAQAFRLLEKGRYTAVVADTRLPDMEHAAFVGKVRRIDEGFSDGETPLVFMCEGDPLCRDTIANSACEEQVSFIEKPVHKEALLSVIAGIDRKARKAFSKRPGKVDVVEEELSAS